MKREKEIDEFNQNTLWWDAIMKDMKSVRPAFEEWEGTAYNTDAAYQKVTCHMIFDVKMLDSEGIFRRKARYVAGGHTKETPSALICTYAVSRDLLLIALTLASLNLLDILASDIHNP